MTEERYISDAPPLTAHEREVVDIFCEECAEAIQAASKMKRFGPDDHSPSKGEEETNRRQLGLEIGDLTYMIDRLKRLGLVSESAIDEGYDRKEERLKKYLQTRPGEYGRGERPPPEWRRP